jgi:glutamyl-tRNA synthetase
MNPDPKKDVRVRFAPSPTGPFSIGNARTALFNWLYTRHHEGKFLVRIEDTDKKRSKKEYEKEMFKSLEWLGLNWDEEPVYQSQRTDVYRKYLEKLIEEGNAFYCFCSEEELEADRQAKISQGLPPTYSGRCRNLGKDEVKKRLERGDKWTIRFKMPDSEIEFNDLVRGRVSFKGSLIGDFVIAKDFDSPLYNFVVVIDDNEMNITHVIRGEDHISNTPKQIAIMQSLGFTPPKYIHLPLILGPGGEKLSKRHLGKSFLEFGTEGYLPEAMANFLLLMGWHPEEDREVVTMEEAIKEFDVKKIQKSGAVYSEDKLLWYNSKYIQSIKLGKLVEYLSDFVPPEWLDNKEFFERVVSVERERIKKLTDFRETADLFFEMPNYEADMLVWKDKRSESLGNLKKIHEYVESLSEDTFDQENLEKYLLDLSRESGGKGEVFWPFRVAMSGKKASPGGLEIAEVIGFRKTKERLKLAVDKADSLYMLD